MGVKQISMLLVFLVGERKEMPWIFDENLIL